MNRAAVAVAMAAALSVTACGGNGSEDARTAPAQATLDAVATAASPPPVVLTEAQLETALVQLSDLPAGYALEPDSPDDETDVEGKTPECTEAFKELDATDMDASASAEVAYANAQTFTSIQQSWESYTDPDKLQRELDELIALFGTCDTLIIGLDDPNKTKLELVLNDVPFPQIGDAAAAYSAFSTLNVQGQAVPFGVYIAFVRSGGNAMTLFQAGLGQADAGLVQKVAQLSLDRLPAS